MADGFNPFIIEPGTGSTTIGQGGSIKIEVDFQSTSPLILFSIEAGDIIERVEITVETSWNSPSPTIEIGVPADPDQIFEINESNLKKLGTYSADHNHRFTGAATLRAILDHDGATQGSGFIIIYIVRN